jgi:hypothetical protein
MLGFTPPELANEPDIPEGYDYLLGIFWPLFYSCDQKISYQEIKAFIEIDGTCISAMEAEALIRLSNAARSKLADMQENIK